MNVLTRFAPVAVSSLIAFLAYGSQLLFRYIEPGRLSKDQELKFNLLVAFLWICYVRACLVNPGHVKVIVHKNGDISDPSSREQQRGRWCRTCSAPKPPRAHHCRTCQRCIPKMDHHCPWTINCVSYRTFPHFMRFLVYATAAMGYLEYFLHSRALDVWEKRNLPSYLGPSALQLAVLFVLTVANSMTFFLVGVMCLRTFWSLAFNTTTIESWEIERHQVLLRRARVSGGYLSCPDGSKLRIAKQEFPYDIGIWSNITQGMNGGVLSWLWPFASSPSMDGGCTFEINDFEDPSLSWPPPDPDRMAWKAPEARPAFTHAAAAESDAERLASFKRRQQEDLDRRRDGSPPHRRRPPFYKRYDHDTGAIQSPEVAPDGEGEEAWRTSDGERLGDFGVDEDVEFYDEEKAPLAQRAKSG